MILDQIVQAVQKKIEIEKKKRSLAWYQQQAFVHPPKNLFRNALAQPGMQVIAEIKKASPSVGLIATDFEPVAIAREYAAANVAAISILTEEDHFQGSLDNLQQVRQAVTIPLLRKDFIIDPYQLYQAGYYGANCVLLIVGILDDARLSDFMQLARYLQMNTLVEVHDESELERALTADADIIGINNRNLKTFEVDLNTSIQLRQRIPKEKLVVGESGIKTALDVRRLREANIDAILVGESIMRQKDKTAAIQALLNGR